MKQQSALAALAALAQGSRLAVFRLLVQHGPSGMAAGEIAAQLKLAPATLSFHLKELAHAGLVTARQEGRFVFYAADFAAMNELIAFLTENCCSVDCGPGASCSPAAPAAPARAARPQAPARNRKPQRSKV
jgi:DNA-binding transcriptional ArsR family regulator